MADHKGGHDLRKQIHLTDKAEIAGIVLKTVNDETIDNTDTTEINLNVTNTTQTSETETGDNSDMLSASENNNTEGRNVDGENPTGAARVTGPAESTVMSRDQHTTAAGHSNDVTISMFQQLMQSIQQINADLSVKIESQKQDLSCNMESLKHDLNATLERNNTVLEQRFEKISQNMEQQNEEIKQNFGNMCLEMKKRQQEVQVLRRELNETNNQLQSLEINTDQRLIEYEKKLEGEISNLHVNQGKLHNKIREVEVTQIDEHQHVEEMREMIIPQINETRIKITEHQKTINSLTGDMERMREDLTAAKNQPAPAQIIYAGDSHHIVNSAPPKFNGRTNNPKEFLEKFRRYYQRSLKRPYTSNLDPQEHLLELIENSFEQNAAGWFAMVKEEIQDWQSFELVFEKKYWSRDIQRGVRQRLATDRYWPGRNLTRTEYFTERVIILRSLTPPMTEEEIVAHLAEHFDSLTQDARRVQNIQTITDFESLLQREDLEDKNRRSQQNPRPALPRLEPTRSPTGPRPNNNVWTPTRPSQPPYQPRPPYQPPNNQVQNNNPNGRTYTNTFLRRDRATRPPPRDNRGRTHDYPTPEQSRICHLVAEQNIQRPDPEPPPT